MRRLNDFAIGIDELHFSPSFVERHNYLTNCTRFARVAEVTQRTNVSLERQQEQK